MMECGGAGKQGSEQEVGVGGREGDDRVIFSPIQPHTHMHAHQCNLFSHCQLYCASKQ